MPQTGAANAPITENESVKELLAILDAHHSASKKDFLAVINQVGAMERQLDAAVKELAGMRRELAEAQKNNHPVVNAMRNAVAVMQEQVTELRKQLAVLKQTVIDGCKNAVTAFKEKGISALSNITRFFKIKPILEAVHTTAHRAAMSADQAIAKIEAVSAEYHEAGRHLKNMGRAMTGKEAIQEARPPGAVAKTVSAPFRAVRACFAGIRNQAVGAVNNLKRLEAQAQRKPSIKKTMQRYNEKIEREGRAAPDRPRPAKAER